jgi:CheY-like chemotaxis protein
VRWIRAREAHGPRRTPAVAVTAYGRADDQASTAAAGFDRHMVKAIDIADVVAAVAALCRPAGLSRAASAR